MARKAATEKTPRKLVADFDPRSVEPFAPFTVRIEDPDTLLYLAIAAARDAYVSEEAPATGPEQARAALTTAGGRHMALWKYAATGGAKARPGTRIAYAPLDPQLAPERELVKFAAAGVNLLDMVFEGGK